jgi:site-specific DNA-methyltransferase (adenine-specific)
MGRWPANVSFSEEAAAQLDLQSGNRPGMSGGGAHRADYAGGMFGAIDATHVSRNDEGGASRFFFCAKASRFERDFGCEDLHQRSAADTVGREDGAAALDSPRTGAGRTSGARNHHPCVKPLASTSPVSRFRPHVATKRPADSSSRTPGADRR